MANKGQNEGEWDSLQHAYEDVRRELARAKEELVYWKNSATAAAQHSRQNVSLEGLDTFLLRVDVNGTVQYANSAFCSYMHVSRLDVEGHPVKFLSRFIDDTIVRLLSIPGEDQIVQIQDTSHNIVLEIKLTWKNGSLDAVMHDVTSNVMFRNYVMRYVPSALRDIPEEDLYTFRYPDRRFMTVAFTDLRGFTALSETLGPEEVRATLNNYLEEIITAIEDNYGTVDKIIGDEVMSLYGAPRYFKDHALRAIKTACDQQLRLRKLQKTFHELGRVLPDCGIGIHTGDMIVGNIGSSTRQDYTVLGSAVNLASHLCSAAHGGEILVSEVTLQEALDNLPGDWETLETTWDSDTDSLYVGGKIEGVYLLEGNRLGRAIMVGPGVAENPENAELCFRYLYALKIKGIADLVPVISVTSPKDDSTLVLDPNQVIQVTSERILGKYRLQEVIGRGGMGEIWKARDSFGNEVAIKTLIAGEAATEKQIKRFKREAETMAKLVHRSICRVLEVGEVDRISYIAMEYVDGVDLADLLIYKSPTFPQRNLYHEKPLDLGALTLEIKKNRDGSAPAYELDTKGDVRFRILPETQIIEITLKICSAVQYAHSHGILHRDIKPANIMIRTDGEPIVTDFGLAKVQTERGDVSLSMTGQLVGTLEYMAPEQSSNSHSVNEAVDVYSIGAILYLMVTGEKHFSTTGNLLNDIKALQEFEPKRPRTYNKEIDPDLETIILKALSPDPTRRYRNIMAFRGDLDRYKNGEVISAKEQSLIEVFAKTIKRNRALSIAIVSSFAVLLSGFIFYTFDISKRNKKLQQVIAQMEQANRERERAEMEKEVTSRFAKEKEREANEKDRFAKEKEREAQTSTQEYRAIKDSVVRDFVNLSREAEKNRQYTEGAEYAKKALERAADNSEVWWQLGQCLDKMNRLEEAQQAFQKAASLNPSDNRYHDSFRRVTEAIQFSSTFLGKYEKSLATNSALTQGEHAQAGDIYMEKGRFDDAAKAYRTANSLPNIPFSLDIRLKQFNADARILNPKYDVGKKRFNVANGKVAELDLRNEPINTVPTLERLDIPRANLSGSQVNSLHTFAGSTVKSIDISRTPVTDISPLARAAVEELIMENINVQDLSPIRSMGLKILRTRGLSIPDYSIFSGLSFDVLDLSESKIADVSKLGAVKARELILAGTPVQGVNFATGCRIRNLNISGTRVSEIDMLLTQPIEALNISRTRVTDLAPLTYNAISRLNISSTSIMSLEPIRKMPLVELDIRKTSINDLTPLIDCPLENVYLDPEKIVTGMEVLRKKSTIKQLGKDQLMPAAQFWKAYDAGDFSRPGR